MTARQRVLALVDSFGARLDDRGREITIEAPPGHLWGATLTHELVSSRWDDDTKADLWKRLRDDLAYGTVSCDDPRCDWCCPGPESPGRFQGGESSRARVGTGGSSTG